MHRWYGLSSPDPSAAPGPATTRPPPLAPPTAAPSPPWLAAHSCSAASTAYMSCSALAFCDVMIYDTHKFATKIAYTLRRPSPATAPAPDLCASRCLSTMGA